MPGVWSGATDGTSERFTAKAKRPSWRTSLAQRLPLRQPRKLPQAVGVDEAQPLALPLALPLRQALKPPQAVAVDEAQPLALPLALPLRQALKPPQAVAVDEAQPLALPLALPLRQPLKLPQPVAVGEAEGEADSLPPEDAEWWTSTLYGGCTQEKFVTNSYKS